MKIVEIRIGRNLPTGGELDRVTWAQFQTDAADLITSTFITPYESVAGPTAWVEVHLGRGVWDGGSEDSAVITGYYKPAADIPSANLAGFEYCVERLAAAYKQQAIGVVYGLASLREPKGGAQ